MARVETTLRSLPDGAVASENVVRDLECRVLVLASLPAQVADAQARLHGLGKGERCAVAAGRTGARLENGLLHIELVRELPEAMKPRNIAIETAAPAERKVIEDKAA